MDFLEDIQKMGLTVEQYDECIRDIQGKINGENDIEWEEICLKYNLPITTSTLRKANSKPFGGAFIKSYLESKGRVNAPVLYAEQLDEIRKEKQRLNDERTALKKISRENARGEENFGILKQLIQTNGVNTFKPQSVKVEDNGNDIIACLSDLHIGMDVMTNFGVYNPEIAKKRLCDYIVEIIKIQHLHHSQNIYLCLLGDQINGSIHPTVQLENRENVIQQIQMAAEAISAFAYELSCHFENVYVADVPGNHSRIGLKDNCLRDERLDDLIKWYMEAKLEHLPNVVFIDRQYDSTIGSIMVRDNEFLLCHGDYDAFSEAGLNKLCMFIGHKPAGVLLGHLHHCTYDDINDVKLIRSGSFVGACGNYEIQKRLYNKPSQMVCVVDDKGVKAFYPVILK